MDNCSRRLALFSCCRITSFIAAGLFCTVLVLHCYLSSAADYYVSNYGKDTNPGTLQDPFKTIQKAANTMQPRDTCYIRAGIYRECVELKKKNELKFTNHTRRGGGKEYVLITGCDTVGGWAPHGGSDYKANFSVKRDLADFHPGWATTQVFVDGKRMPMAREPDEKGDMLSFDDWANVTVYREDGEVEFHDEIKHPKKGWKGGIFHSQTGRMWSPPQGIIESSKVTKVSVRGGVRNATQIYCDDQKRTGRWRCGRVSCCDLGDEGPCGLPHPPGRQHDKHKKGKGYGFITNHLEALDSPGEWHWDESKGVLYLRPPCGVNMEKQNKKHKHTIEARVRRWGFKLENCSEITVNGLHFKAASVKLQDSTDCKIEKCSFRYLVPFLRMHYGQGTLGHSASQGILVSGSTNSRNTIEGCYIAHSWGTGINLDGGKDSVVRNCIIEDVNWMGIYESCVKVWGNGHVIGGNTMRRSGRYHVLLLYAGKPLKRGYVGHNHMIDAMLLSSDGGPINAGHHDGEGTIIAYNWVNGNHSEQAGIGIYLDGGATGYVVHHNVVWNCNRGFHQGHGKATKIHNQVYNNTFWVKDAAIKLKSAAMSEGGQRDASTVIDTRNNLVNHPDLIGTDLKNVTCDDPGQFMDYANGDFRIRITSPARDAGRPILLTIA